MLSKLLKARTTRAAVAGALVATVFAFSTGAPQAAPQSKTLTASCAGADPASQDLLKAFGGTLNLPFTVSSDVPATLEPEAPDQPISFTWGVTIDAKTTSAVAAVSPSLLIKDVSLDIGVTGPTATTEVLGRPAPVTLAITAGQPATINQGPFAGTLTKIGKGGLIKYSAKKVALTISLTISGKATDVKVECAAPGTVATTSIKIPGSPDIKQPIELEGTPDSTVSVDVLGQYVTPTADEKGTVHPVDPASLKVLDGPGQISNGQVVVSTGAAGTTSSVTFEVCSGSLPGVNAVQSLQIDPSILLGPPKTGEDGKPIPGTEEPVLDKDGKTQTNMVKKSVGLTLKFGDQETPVIWTVPKSVRDANPGKFQKPENWADTYNSDMIFWIFFVPFQQPDPADIQAALESLPSIGAGGVKVTNVPVSDPKKPVQYNIEFTGKNGQKDVPNLTIGSYYSVFPQEHLQAIIDAAKGMLGGGGDDGPTTTTTLPGGAQTVDEAIDFLIGQIKDALLALDFEKAKELAAQLGPLLKDKALGSIPVDQVISALTGIFTTPPSVATVTAGEDPVGMCSQGVIDVSVPAPPPPTVSPEQLGPPPGQMPGAEPVLAG